MNVDPKRVQANLSGIGPVQPTSPKPAGNLAGVPGQFQDAVRRATGTKTENVDVTISAHASQRLMQRGVMLDQQDMRKISNAMDQAQAKGAKESLFLMRDLALIVSVENRTVITALQGQQAKENVFTQIDSAVLID